MTTIRASTFAGASSLPLYVAVERGFFAAFGLDIELSTTRSSDELMGGLVEGGFEVVHAAPDNFIAWRDRLGAPIVAWIGGTSGPISLVGRRGLESVADLAGRSIAVDAPTSGFVSILRRLLRDAGVDPGSVTLELLGATHLRASALRDGRTDASMLTLPWSAVLARDGLPILAEGRSVLPRLQGSSGASLQPWLEAHADMADAYLRATIAATTWLQTPEHAADVRAILVRRYEIDEGIAEVVRAAFVDPVGGWPPSAIVDPIGMASVCELRTENGAQPRERPEAYLDPRPYRRVLGFGLLDR